MLNILTKVVLNFLSDIFIICVISEFESAAYFVTSSFVLFLCFGIASNILLKVRHVLPDNKNWEKQAFNLGIYVNYCRSYAVFNACCSYRCQGLHISVVSFCVSSSDSALVSTSPQRMCLLQLFALLLLLRISFDG